MEGDLVSADAATGKIPGRGLIGINDVANISTPVVRGDYIEEVDFLGVHSLPLAPTAPARRS